LIVDPMLGSGTAAVAAHLAGRQFIGGDVNSAAVRFAAARLLDEHLWPAWRQPALFAA
jgi:DNA modification methylase